MLIFVHLNNDFSGSPKILRDVIEVAESEGIPYKLYVSSSSGHGFLSQFVPKASTFWFRRSPKSRALTFLFLCISQAHLFFKLLFDRDITTASVIYVNALLPFGAKFYALMTRKRLVCHIHELSLSPYIFNQGLLLLNRISANLNIFVSNSHCGLADIKGVDSLIVPNSVEGKLLEEGLGHSYCHKHNGDFVVLMICGAARYKGIPEFFELARRTAQRQPGISFELVLNCSEDQLHRFSAHEDIPDCLSLSSVTDNVAHYYRSASLLVNLSRIDMWIETFGLTLVEAMSFGVPVIAPPLGGPVDIVTHDYDGFLIDSRDLDAIADAVIELYQDEGRHRVMSQSAKAKAQGFSEVEFKARMARIIIPLAKVR